MRSCLAPILRLLVSWLSLQRAPNKEAFSPPQGAQGSAGGFCTAGPVSSSGWGHLLSTIKCHLSFETEIGYWGLWLVKAVEYYFFQGWFSRNLANWNVFLSCGFKGTVALFRKILISARLSRWQTLQIKFNNRQHLSILGSAGMLTSIFLKPQYFVDLKLWGDGNNHLPPLIPPQHLWTGLDSSHTWYKPLTDWLFITMASIASSSAFTSFCCCILYAPDLHYRHSKTSLRKVFLLLQLSG